jgi:hypothetical protein
VQEDNGSISEMNVDVAQGRWEGGGLSRGGVDDVVSIPVSPGHFAFAREDSYTRMRGGKERVRRSREVWRRRYIPSTEVTLGSKTGETRISLPTIN